MTIDINIDRSVNSECRTYQYFVDLTWSIDNFDNIDIETLRKGLTKVEEQIEETLHDAWLAGHLNNAH